MTLTEFLLARVAEDEAKAGRPEAGWIEPYEEGLCWHLGSDDSLDMLVANPARVLAECEAKRKIVEDFEVLQADYRATHSPETEARRFQALVAASHLAAIYADHPDYRDEWKR